MTHSSCSDRSECNAQFECRNDPTLPRIPTKSRERLHSEARGVPTQHVPEYLPMLAVQGFGIKHAKTPIGNKDCANSWLDQHTFTADMARQKFSNISDVASTTTKKGAFMPHVHFAADGGSEWIADRFIKEAHATQRIKAGNLMSELHAECSASKSNFPVREINFRSMVSDMAGKAARASASGSSVGAVGGVGIGGVLGASAEALREEELDRRRQEMLERRLAENKERRKGNKKKRRKAE